jgi:predicted GIY-YIG superfamily endonuclease
MMSTSGSKGNPIDIDNSDECDGNGKIKATCPSSTKAAGTIEQNLNKKFSCYLLRSLDDKWPKKTYIGCTNNPSQRIRQHNGDLKGGGARRTAGAGRPWSFVVIVHGFDDYQTALQFEWAWQHANHSVCFKNALEEHAAASSLLHQRKGVEAKMDIMRILICNGEPYCRLPLQLFFNSEDLLDAFKRLMENKYIRLNVPRNISLKLKE